jgi:hypothetical protein
MVLLVTSNGSAKTFYTTEELIRSITEGFTLDDEELQERITQSYNDYLESDTYAYLLEIRTREVINNFPDINYDYASMLMKVTNIDGVRSKFNNLRTLNSGAEEASTKKYVQSEVGRSEFLSRLFSFYYSFIKSLGKEYEYELILIQQYVDILNDELNYGVDNIPNLFAEGVGAALGSIVTLIGDGISGLATSLGIDPDLLKAIIIGGLVLFGIGIGGVIVSKVAKRRRK